MMHIFGLLRALLLQIFYRVRSEGLLNKEIADAFFQRVLARAKPPLYAV